jgi:hypothetical protein
MTQHIVSIFLMSFGFLLAIVFDAAFLLALITCDENTSERQMFGYLTGLIFTTAGIATAIILIVERAAR